MNRSRFFVLVVFVFVSQAALGVTYDCRTGEGHTRSLRIVDNASERKLLYSFDDSFVTVTLRPPYGDQYGNIIYNNSFGPSLKIYIRLEPNSSCSFQELRNQNYVFNFVAQEENPPSFYGCCK